MARAVPRGVCVRRGITFVMSGPASVPRAAWAGAGGWSRGTRRSPFCSCASRPSTVPPPPCILTVAHFPLYDDEISIMRSNLFCFLSCLLTTVLFPAVILSFLFFFAALAYFYPVIEYSKTKLDCEYVAKNYIKKNKNLNKINREQLRMLSTNFCNGGDEIYEIKNIND